MATSQVSTINGAKTIELRRLRFELMAAEFVASMGARIRERREELGMTQHQLARALPGDVLHTQVSKWERGINRPRDDTLDAIAKALKVDVSYFMTSPPDKSETPNLLGAGASQLDRMEAKLDAILQALDVKDAAAPAAGPDEFLGPLAASGVPDPETAPRRKQARGRRRS